QTLQILPLNFQILLFTVNLFQSLVDGLLLLAKGIFTLVQRVVALVNFLLVLRFQLKILLLCFQQAVLFQMFRILLRILQNALSLILNSNFLFLEDGPQEVAAYPKAYNDS